MRLQIILCEQGTKRRSSGKYEAMDEDIEKEKKIKLDAKTNELSDILASQEVVEQPCRVQ